MSTEKVTPVLLVFRMSCLGPNSVFLHFVRTLQWGPDNTQGFVLSYFLQQFTYPLHYTRKQSNGASQQAALWKCWCVLLGLILACSKCYSISFYTYHYYYFNFKMVQIILQNVTYKMQTLITFSSELNFEKQGTLAYDDFSMLFPFLSWIFFFLLSHFV